MSQASLSYRAGTSETGIQTEMYLPKKSYFQSTLYDTLTAGFNHDHVKKTLIDNIEEVKRLMNDFTVPIISKGLQKARIEKMKRIFSGYSMYEVDGVFCASPVSGRRVDEERTQVVRVLFKPDLDDIQRALEEKDIETTSDSIKNTIYDLYQPNGMCREGLSDEQKKEISGICNYLEDWRWDIQLFLFGYVINEICKQIEKLGKSIKPEDEIWITSFWSTQISRVVL
jgi:hypothetical protein